MMWSDLKAVLAWFRGEGETKNAGDDPGVASLMRLVAANTMANIRKAQEQSENLPYQSDESDIDVPSSNDDHPVIEAGPTSKSSINTAQPGAASTQSDEQNPPQGA
ncbi:MAG: hypothetical protein KI786_15285 [Mameliella sp.]|nr:hypothetical protein [Phaeodactylibacter sp.]NRA47593.1 hypothetical protein [Phaeodactylibacter sp.]